MYIAHPVPITVTGLAIFLFDNNSPLHTGDTISHTSQEI